MQSSTINNQMPSKTMKRSRMYLWYEPPKSPPRVFRGRVSKNKNNEKNSAQKSKNKIEKNKKEIIRYLKEKGGFPFVGSVPKTRFHFSKIPLIRLSKLVIGENEIIPFDEMLSLICGSLRPDDFIIRELLSSGGFSSVYTALSKSRRERVVLKVLNHSLLTKLNFSTDDIRREIEIGRKMKHYNIVSLYGYYQTQRDSVLVMEWCGGGDLHDFIQSPSFITVSYFKKLEYIRQMASAVEYFQQTTNYIHMDVKPENLLLTPDKSCVKLSDFGCSVRMREKRQIHKTHNGGTHSYQPPEMLQDSLFDSTVDVWAIGCVAYQLLSPSNSHPFFPSPTVVPMTPEMKKREKQIAIKSMIQMRSGKNEKINESLAKIEQKVKIFIKRTIGTSRLNRPLISKLIQNTEFITSNSL